MYLDRQRYTVFWPYTICRPNTKTKINRTSGQTHTQTVSFFFLHVAIRNSLRSNNTRIKCTAREGRSKSSRWRRSLFVQGQVANGDLSRSVNGIRGFMLQCQENLGVQLPQKRNRGFTVRGGGLPCQGHHGARLPPKGNRGFIVVTD